MSVSTWASEEGIWYASVPQYAYARPDAVARRAIRRELADRERNFDPRSTVVSLYKVENHRLIYRELAR